MMEREDPWDENDGEELEGEILRADHPFAADLRGTTPEEAEGELSIDDALARERPEKPTVDEVIALEDEGGSDEEGELVADDSVERDDFASPEESALSIRGTAPGATDHEDQHGLDED
jgi:hypothetical protein